MSSVSVSPHAPEIVYVNVCVPGPATTGSKTPSAGSVMPVPDHVPPASAATSVVATASSQYGPAGVIVASPSAITIISSESVLPQEPGIE